jgi:UDP-galactopyranose mutase
MGKAKFLIVGSGFSGAVLAHELALMLDCQIEVWDEREHVGGNCYTERDSKTGIIVHLYGPHIFNTDRKDIWEFVNRFTTVVPFTNRVKAYAKGNIYSFPINLHTINQFFHQTFGPKEAEAFIRSIGDHSFEHPENFEQQALKFVGRELYEAFFHGYTKKQWGCEPSELPASILKRLPVRFNYNDNYYNNPYQGVPINGYTEIFERLLDNPRIKVLLGRKYNRSEEADFDYVFYTGPIDAFFDYKFGRLSYRTVTFERNHADGDFQGNAVINYCDEKIPYTRIHEHKHFAPWESHKETVYFKEFSKETEEGDIPYYPKRLSADKDKLSMYRKEAEQLKNTGFLGRLATYRYMDMHHVIGEAIDFSKRVVTNIKSGQSIPVFPNTEE